MSLDRGGLSLLDDADLVPRSDEAADVKVEAEAGNAGGEKVVVDVGEDAEDASGDLGVLAEEAVPVADFEHEDNVGVLGSEVDDL